MTLTRWEIKFLVGSILIAILALEKGLASHHHHLESGKDDDDDDHDPECHPGRNCRPGCYCTSSYCRPYFPPHNDYLKKYACRGYNYPPRWKIWKKGSKNSADNSTIMIVMAHHQEVLDPEISMFLKENNFTTHDNYELPVPFVVEPPSSHEVLKSNVSMFGNSTTVIDLIPSTTSTPSNVVSHSPSSL